MQLFGTVLGIGLVGYILLVAQQVRRIRKTGNTTVGKGRVIINWLLLGIIVLGLGGMAVTPFVGTNSHSTATSHSKQAAVTCPNDDCAGLYNFVDLFNFYLYKINQNYTATFKADE